MSIDYQKLRLDGLYQQDKDGHLMLRVKIPAGVLSSTQAETLCDISEQHSNGVLHLTCRGSIEFHWLDHESLPDLFRQLSSVGLSSRGACGGAVRGISCSTTFNPGFPYAQVVARRINRHFAGNPHFEGLPKKFKVSIDAGYEGARHLIQDIGLVYVGGEEEEALFDVWCAGGLGREPQAAFLLEEQVPEARLIPLIEATAQVYRENTPPPKRLKFLLNQVGETAFRTLLDKQLAQQPQLNRQISVDGPLMNRVDQPTEIPIFAGELDAANMRHLAALARDLADGFLAITADQNIVLMLPPEQSQSAVFKMLGKLDLPLNRPENQVNFRVCPGNHECRMGLAATRDIARQVIQAITSSVSDATCGLTWAISGCPNSCSQPQLADFGIVTSKLVKAEDGTQTPLFDLYGRQVPQLGECIADKLTLEELCTHISRPV